MQDPAHTGSTLTSSDHRDRIRVARVITWLSIAGTAFLLMIGLRSAWSGDMFHTQVLFAFAAVLLLNEFIYRRSGNTERQRQMLIALVLLLFAYLASTGGQSNTGPLWFYVFPPLAFFILDHRGALFLTGVCLLFALVVFQFPQLPFVTTEYHPDFQLRFLASVAFVTGFCAVLDLRRRDARQELLSLAALYEKAAKTDELTGLPNRRAMQNQLLHEFHRFQRSGHHFSVILLDIDHFKQANDHYGHDAGDQALQQFAELLGRLCRTSDLASRWGGEEFLLLLPDTSLLEALALAERLRAAVERHEFTHDGRHIPVTISAGVCTTAKAHSIEELLRQADNHLYSAKAQGRNRINPSVRRNQALKEAEQAPV